MIKSLVFKFILWWCKKYKVAFKFELKTTMGEFCNSNFFMKMKMSPSTGSYCSCPHCCKHEITVEMPTGELLNEKCPDFPGECYMYKHNMRDIK